MSQIALIAIIAASLLVMVVVWQTLKRGLVSPLMQVLASIKGLASGNFRQQFDANRRDELGQLARDLSHMQGEIAGIIGAVQSTTGELHRASSAITRSSGDIVNHTSETELCSEQVAAAITEMSQTVLEVAGSASSVAASAEQVDTASQNGLQHMQRTIESINALSSDVSLVSQAMGKLEQDTAAIEAARAGEQGRGFAVVNLVQSSHGAALQSAKIATEVDQASLRLQQLVHRFSV